MKVFFATPAFDGKVNIQFAHSMIETLGLLLGLGIDAINVFHGHCAYLQCARNTLATKFLESDCTDLFFIDSDLGWDAKAVPRILVRPYDFVGGAYPFKSTPEDYPVTINTDTEGRPLVDKETGCISANMLPSGFWRLRRKVIESMADGCDWYMDKGIKTYDLFQTPTFAHEWVGEDVAFCRKWRQRLGQIWLEPNIDFVHVGAREHAGNYHRYLLQQPGGSDAEQMKSETSMEEKENAYS